MTEEHASVPVFLFVRARASSTRASLDDDGSRTGDAIRARTRAFIRASHLDVMSAPTRALEELLDGYRAYRSAHFGDGSRVREDVDVRGKLDALARDGQKPRALVVSCCDSRADPALVFDAREPGEIFVVRNVANLVPPFEGVGGPREGGETLAALEYAVTRLRVPLVVVMGHTRCGGVAASLQKYDDGPECDPHAFEVNEATGEGFIGNWVALARETTRRTRDETEGWREMSASERARALERENVKQSVKNVETFPFVASRVASGDLVVAGAVFDVADGTLWTLDDDTGEFARVDDGVSS